MSTLVQVEDALIAAITALGVFQHISSASRQARPLNMPFPAALVKFDNDKNTGTEPRPVFHTMFEILVADKNADVQPTQTIYNLMDSVRDAINGKFLGLADIDLFILESRDFVVYEDGITVYSLKFRTRHILPVPTAQ